MMIILSARAAAVSVEHIGFDDLVSASDAIVDGKVIAVDIYYRRGKGDTSSLPNSASSGKPPQTQPPSGTSIDQQTRPPRRQPLSPTNDSLNAADRMASRAQTIRRQRFPAPQSLGVENSGNMLFTRVTMAVTRTIVGDMQEDVLTFSVAGGRDGERRVWVPGMPEFELGKRYLLFLSPARRYAAVPVVGVYQGFFEVAIDAASGTEMLLNSQGDIVIGVENNRIVVRRNPQRRRSPDPQLGPAPEPDAGYTVHSGVSPAVERYWRSPEAPMSVDAFVNRVLDAKAR